MRESTLLLNGELRATSFDNGAKLIVSNIQGDIYLTIRRMKSRSIEGDVLGYKNRDIPPN